MIPFVFVLGRPGSGKSEVAKSFGKRDSYPFTALHTSRCPIAGTRVPLDGADFCFQKLGRKYGRLDDVRELNQLFKTDKEHKYIKPSPLGGFTVVDCMVFDTILQKVCADALQQHEEGKTLFIEFARANYVEALTKNFTPDVLEKSLIVYLHTPVSLSLERTRKRWQEVRNSIAMEAANPCSTYLVWLIESKFIFRDSQQLRSVSMDHMVPGSVLEEFYKTDDREALFNNPKWRVIDIDNSKDNMEEFKENVARVLKIITSGNLPEKSMTIDELIDLEEKMKNMEVSN